MGTPVIGTAQPWRARLLATLSLAAIGVLVGLAVAFLVTHAGWVVLGLLGVLVIVVGAWWSLIGRARKRVAGGVMVLCGAGLLAGALVGAGDSALQVVVRLAIAAGLLLVAVAAGRQAMVDVLRPVVAAAFGPAAPPRRPVLICNPRSGGGKVDRFGLIEMAEAIGVETVQLSPGLDLEELARQAIAGGADCLAMAGGDGSQALVASIAIEHDLPFVCISAGTRNHFALDLGLNRDDPREGMAAFRDALVREVDYATVNGRLFVNNVSLGVYATIVHEEGYREAKVQTTTTLLPELLGRTDEPFDLQFTSPDGREVDGAFLVQVSNNPYVLGPSLDLSRRRRLDTGRLGVVAVSASNGAEAAAAVTESMVGRGATARHVFTFTCPTFEVRARSGVIYAGVDGEALELQAPLEFAIHARGLRMLVPAAERERSIRRRTHEFHAADLVAVVLGHAPERVTT